MTALGRPSPISSRKGNWDRFWELGAPVVIMLAVNELGVCQFRKSCQRGEIAVPYICYAKEPDTFQLWKPANWLQGFDIGTVSQVQCTQTPKGGKSIESGEELGPFDPDEH